MRQTTVTGCAFETCLSKVFQFLLLTAAAFRVFTAEHLPRSHTVACLLPNRFPALHKPLISNSTCRTHTFLLTWLKTLSSCRVCVLLNCFLWRDWVNISSVCLKISHWCRRLLQQHSDVLFMVVI